MLRLKSDAEPPRLEGAIDADAYRRLADIMEEELPTIVAEFIESTERLLSEIALAEADRDPMQIKKRAHNIKSSSAVLGALQLSAIAREVERIAGNGSLAFPSTVGETLGAEFNRVRSELRRLAGAQ